MTYLYLPITSQPRELDAKLLLALVAKEQGITPVLGYKTTFRARLPGLKPGTYLSHNARDQAKFNDEIAALGHRIFALDEEALVRQSDEIFLRKHPENAFEHVHRVLCWGEDDAQMWERCDITPPCGTKIVGNPRMDLLRPELAAYYAERVAELHDLYGEYVLLNTNFPTVNNATPQGGGVRMKNWALDDRGQQIEQEFLSNKKAMFEATLALLKPLAEALAPLSLVLRPHPNEDHTPWEKVAAELDNVHVTFEGGVVPWLIGAKALVHNNCTTAVESAVAGTPIINFRPWYSNYDNPLAHDLGTDCKDATAIAEAIRNLPDTSDSPLTDAQRERLRFHVASYDGDLSCDRIAAYVKDPDGSLAPGTPPGFFYRSKLALSLRWLWIKRFAKLLVSNTGKGKRRFLKENFPDYSIWSLDFAMLNYSQQQLDLMMRQYPPLDIAELEGRIARFAKSTGRFAGLHAVMDSGGLFTIKGPDGRQAH